MKMWKKLMVFAVSILLISAILAAQYVSVSTNAYLQIDTQHAELQLFAGDPSIAGTSIGGINHDYLLEYDGTAGFMVNLGTWGAQNQFISTAAFGVANAGGATIRITNIRIVDADGDNHTEFLAATTIIIHGDYHALEDNGETFVDVSAWEGGDYIELLANDTAGAYYDSVLNITNEEDDITASWVESGSDGDDLWYLDPEADIPFPGKNEPGTSNAFWVRIEVDPSGVVDGTEMDDVYIFFDVIYDWD